ncbi:hypothetical protein [Caballeronia sp. KNU42]
MNDLALIETAASAAGLHPTRYRVRELEVVYACTGEGGKPRYFNPLMVDTDANLIAALIGIDVIHLADGVCASRLTIAHVSEPLNVDQLPDSDGKERMRAMRRAITNCAARCNSALPLQGLL